MPNAFSMLRRATREATDVLAAGIDRSRTEALAAKDEITGLTSPFVGSGPNTAQSQLMGLLGLGGAGPEAALQQLQGTPGYQFAVEQANRGLERSAAARGQLLSGNTLAELANLNQGLASQQFNTRVGQLGGLVGQFAPLQIQNIAGTSATLRDLALQRAQAESDAVLKQADITLGNLFAGQVGGQAAPQGGLAGLGQQGFQNNLGSNRFEVPVGGGFTAGGVTVGRF